MVSFKSQAYAGQASNTYITNHCGILERLEPGDVVLVDEGFPQIDTSNTNGAFMVIPPSFKSGRSAKEEVDTTEEIASLRIHVERAIGRVRTFRVLNITPRCLDTT
ncbi:Hypothetical protein NTJ_00984 [Nesidiocoris tenuis]|uniref:DDE Tnp4 domain-containing protein n=1 Tax=Nesidiocoris tenuis TaxID=355587 RepID=A0ABN7A885_9HEMI|nr:Hypothetical protein NTJ_00984 [Nesidiocoris tenuis]